MQSKLLNRVTNYYSDQKLAPLLNGYVLGGVSSWILFSKDRNCLKLDTANGSNAKKLKMCHFSKSDSSDVFYLIDFIRRGE